jgi:hypothetical protein
MTRQVTLLVNDSPITVDYFVEDFLDHTLGGMIEALEDTGPIRELALTIAGEEVAINLNGKPLRANPFVRKIIRSTTLGMVSVLKGVGAVNKLNINLSR